MKVVHVIGNFQITVIFSLLYFLIFTPIGLIAQIFTDYLKIKSKPKWEDFKLNAKTIDDLKRQ